MLIYLIMTHACNLNCLHCYAASVNGDRESVRKPEVLPIEAVEAFIEVLKQTDAYREEQGKFAFIFHGGEPLLVGEDRIIQVCEAIKKKVPCHGKFEFQLQTNLTLVKDSTVDLIENYFDGFVGTSFDPGIRQLGGSYLKFKFIWERNVRFLVERGVHITVNVTLAGETGRCIKRFHSIVTYLKSLGINNIHIERFLLQGRGVLHKDRLYVSDDDYFIFMHTLLDWYMDYLIRWYRKGSKKEEALFINPLDQMLYLAKFNKGASCFAGDCMGNTLALDCNGDVYSCPAFVFSGKEFSFGNVFRDSAEDIFFNPKRLQSITEQVFSGCEGCDYSHLCHRGCPRQPLTVANRVICQRFFEKLVNYSEKYGHIIKRLLEDNL